MIRKAPRRDSTIYNIRETVAPDLRLRSWPTYTQINELSSRYHERLRLALGYAIETAKSQKQDKS